VDDVFIDLFAHQIAVLGRVLAVEIAGADGERLKFREIH